MQNNLFVYGTLKDPQSRKQVLGRVVTGTPDALQGYGMTQIEIGGEVYPALEPKARNIINGLVLQITDEELKKADDYETSAYKRNKVVLKSGTKAWVYLKK